MRTPGDATIWQRRGRPRSRRPDQEFPPIAVASLPLRAGSTGPDVADLQRRLRAAGFDPGGVDGEFSGRTAEALARFQTSAGLDPDGTCDAPTWSALVEAGYSFGERLLCLRSPMMRGDDVAELQLRLGALGFDAGRVDGIFGQMTQAAVGEYQRNAGLVSDEVCGPETIASLRRLEGRGGSSPVTGVRERDRLRRRAGSTTHLRIAVGAVTADGRPHPVISSLAALLQRGGHTTLLLNGDWSEQAASTNEFDADVYLGLAEADDAIVETSYFSAPGYDSVGGQHLAGLVLRELPAAPGWTIGVAHGKRIPILRETRPPAVLVRLGDPAMISLNHDLVVASFARALDSWAGDPC